MNKLPNDKIQNDNELEQVAGGYIFLANNTPGSDIEKPWEVIDEKGNIVGRFTTEDDAEAFACANNLSTMLIDYDSLKLLRNQK